jgi:hypothetical protein
MPPIQPFKVSSSVFDPFMDMTKYTGVGYGNGTPLTGMTENFAGGVYFPTNENAMQEAEKMGAATAKGIADAYDSANKILNPPKPKTEETTLKNWMNRFNELTKRFKQPSRYDESIGEEEIAKRAEMSGISVNEAKKIALNDKLQAEGRAMDLMKMTDKWKKEAQPLPTYVIGQDALGRDIVSNKPAANAKERADRIQNYNLAPGSLTEWYMGGMPEGSTKEQIAAGRDTISTRNAKETLNKWTKTAESRNAARANNWSWDENSGSYIRTPKSRSITTS